MVAIFISGFALGYALRASISAARALAVPELTQNTAIQLNR
jgi:hypothetical protein